MEKLRLLSPEQLQILTPEQLRIIMSSDHKLDDVNEYKCFFDELSICFESIADCSFRLIDNKVYPIPTPLSNLECTDAYGIKYVIKIDQKDDGYTKFCTRIYENFSKMTTLIQKNNKYLNDICVMFVPYLIPNILNSFIGSYHDTRAIISLISPYDNYGIYKMILVDIKEFNLTYQIDLNKYVLNLSKMNSSLDTIKDPIDYIQHSSYVRYELPLSVTIPKKRPNMHSATDIKYETYDPQNALSKLKFIDMVLLRKHMDLFVGK